MPHLVPVFLDRHKNIEPVVVGPVLAIKNVGTRAAQSVWVGMLGYAPNQEIEDRWKMVGMLPTHQLYASSPFLEAPPGPRTVCVVDSDSGAIPDPKIVTNLPREETEWTFELRWKDGAGRSFSPVRRVLRRIRNPKAPTAPAAEEWDWYDVTFPGEDIEPIAKTLKRLFKGKWKRPTDVDRRKRSDLRY